MLAVIARPFLTGRRGELPEGPGKCGGGICGADLAYLTDRVLLAEGEPQECGTQETARDSRYAPMIGPGLVWLQSPVSLG